MSILEKNQSKGQALLLIIIVLFIVFFLVVSLSENISIDTVNTSQNQSFQKAFVAASSGASAADAFVADNCPGALCPTSAQTYQCPQNVNANGYQCQYVLQPQTAINQVISSDQSVQANVRGSLSAKITFNNPNTIIFLNVILVNTLNDPVSNQPALSYECVYFPSSFNPSRTNVPQGIDSFSNSTLCDPGTPSIGQPNSQGIYSFTFKYAAPAQYIRLYTLNYANQQTKITIDPGNNSIQQYQVIATGFYNNSRREISSYISIYGVPPGIFDYVLFAGGKNASIDF